jgi:hypothetical protein
MPNYERTRSGYRRGAVPEARRFFLNEGRHCTLDEYMRHMTDWGAHPGTAKRQWGLRSDADWLARRIGR